MGLLIQKELQVHLMLQGREHEGVEACKESMILLLNKEETFISFTKKLFTAQLNMPGVDSLK
jgi:hypothetical protein